MRSMRLGGAAIVLIAAAATGTASAQSASPSGSPAGPRPPVLDRFTASFETTTGATRYAAVAHDPDGGKLVYRWSLVASCGALGNPGGTGPANSYEHGPRVRPPDGCAGDVERAARLTLAIADTTGCAIEFTIGARDERVHTRPGTKALACPPAGTAEEGGGFGRTTLVLILAAAVLGIVVMRRIQARPRPPAGIAPKPRRAAPRPAAPAVGDDDDADEWLPASPEDASFEPFEGCLEGSVQNEATEVVAHETVLAGPIVIVAAGEAGTWRVELTEDAETTRAELTESLGVVPGRALEIRADISVRAITAIVARREVCRAGRWVRDGSASRRDGDERVEVLRAKVSTPEEFDRFADEVFAPRLTSLRRGRRRIDDALERARSAPATSLGE